MASRGSFEAPDRMNVSLTPAAEQDLADFGAYLLEESTRLAARIARELETAIGELATAAQHYQLADGDFAVPLRRRVVNPYNVFYWIDGETVRIVRILHGARDYERLIAT